MAKSNAKAAALPTAGGIPEGMTQIGRNNAPTWTPENVGDELTGQFIELNTVEFEEKKRGGKVVEPAKSRRVMTIENEETGRHALWESAALTDLFDQAEEGLVSRVYVRYDGLGNKKPGQNPPKLYTVAVAS